MSAPKRQAKAAGSCRLVGMVASSGAASYLAEGAFELVHSVISGTSHRYVDEDDLQFFKDRIEAAEAPAGCTPWELMMDSDFGHFTYTAWRRTMPVCRLSVLFVQPRRDLCKPLLTT